MLLLSNFMILQSRKNNLTRKFYFNTFQWFLVAQYTILIYSLISYNLLVIVNI